MENEFNATQLNFEIKVTTPSGKEVVINPLAQVSINEENVRREIQLIPAQYAFFTSVYIHSKKKRDLKELELNNRKSAASKFAREEAKKMGKDLNNKQVEEIISQMESLHKLETEFIELEAQTSQLFYLCNALDKKVTSLKSLSYMKSKEDEIPEHFSKSNAMNREGSAINTGINPNRFNDTKEQI